MRDAMQSCLEFCRSVFPVLVMLALFAAWFATVRAERGWEHFVLDLFLMVSLLVVLFFAEAFEIAYTFLSDKNRDEFVVEDAEGVGGAEGKKIIGIIDDIRKQPGLVYEAREWLVTIIIVMITLTAEHSKIYVPFYGEIHDLPVSLGSWSLVIPARMLSQSFSLLFTTLPVIWFAQGPGKKIALRSSVQILLWTRWVWWLVKKVGSLVDAAGLNRPVDWISNLVLVAKIFSRKESFSPSDQGFFLSCLQRYGFGLHDLVLNIQVHEDGSCSVTQKFILYLVRHRRKTFFRQLKFDESEFTAGEFLSVEGYTLAAVGRKYDDIGMLLDQIAQGICPAKVTRSSPKHWDEDNKRLPKGKRDIGVRCGITTYEPVPSEIGSAFAFATEWRGEWKANAVRVANGIDDDFEIKVDYPCRRFSLVITPDAGMQMLFTEVTASATLMENPHTGEENRLKNALNPSPNGVHTTLLATLQYPLPGANYKYEWKVRIAH
jgi:hypothetical protein